MLFVGDIHIYVTDFDRALKFWSQGLGFEVTEKELSSTSPFALLEAPTAGPAIRLFGGAEPWPEETRPDVGSRPTVRFDVVASDFEATLVRLLENGGAQIGEIEKYSDARVVTVADPDGNTFELLEVPED